jgi:hypothetical protein
VTLLYSTRSVSSRRDATVVRGPWRFVQYVVVAAGREVAPWQAPSGELLAEIVIDNIDRLDPRSRLATVFAELIHTSNR